MMIYEDQDLGGSSNEGDNKLVTPLNDENFFSIKLNEVTLKFKIISEKLLRKGQKAKEDHNLVKARDLDQRKMNH